MSQKHLAVWRVELSSCGKLICSPKVGVELFVKGTHVNNPSNNQSGM